MKLSNDFVFIFDEDPCAVDFAIVEAFENTNDAIKWSYANRKQAKFRSVQWLSEQLGMRRATLSRLINHGDFKLDAALIPAWDFLVGNTAVSQYINLCFERFNHERQIMREKAIERKIQS